MFNRLNLKNHRNNTVKGISDSLFIQQAANDIIDRLKMIDIDISTIRYLSKPAYREEFKGDTKHSTAAYVKVREDASIGSTSKLPLEAKFGKMSILEISAKCGYLTKLLKNTYPNSQIIATDMSHILLESFEHDSKICIDEEHLEFPNNSFDLIVYSLGLHWINDVQRFLLNIRNCLKPNGIFIGNFIGGSSLRNLRKSLIELELATGFKHSSHISPFINFDHVPTLLSQAGFSEVIIDYENIKLEFDSPITLMREIKNIGESNSLNLRENYAISKKMYSLLQNHKNGFEDNITLISFIASQLKNSIRLKLL